ncbi:hypothetical protein ACA910_010543 [Epithemia clementina (nom. ined.)]
MTKKEDPTTLFKQILKIENQFNTTVVKEDAIAIILDASPSEYQPGLIAGQRAKGNALTIQDLAEAMDQHWRCVYGKQNTKTIMGEEGTATEVSLAGVAFHGTCYNCKKPGHKTKDCPNKKAGGKSGAKTNNGKCKTCNHCGKPGHNEVDCWNKPENANKKLKWYKPGKAKGEQASAAISTSDINDVEIICMAIGEPMQFPKTTELLYDPCVWIADTAATKHVTRFKQGKQNVRKQAVNVTMGNNLVEKALQVCDLHGTKCNKSGQAEFEIKLRDVALVPTAAFNLFSVAKLQLQGWQLGGDKNSIWLQQGRQKLTFDIKINTPEGCVFTMYVTRDKQENEMGNVVKDQVWTIQQAHDKFGHIRTNKTKEIAKALQINIKKGKVMLPCAACAAGKAKQKNIKQAKPLKQKRGQHRAYLDIASIRKKKGMPIPLKPNWCILVVDQDIQIKFSGFYKTKDEMVEPTCEMLHKWQQSNKNVTHLRMDNAGENKKLKERCESKDWKLNVECKFTARDTPQQNSLAEVGFATLANRGRALMHRANLPMAMR